MDGYRIDVECDEQSLRVRAKNNAARVALTGEDHGDGALVIPRSTIFGVKFKAASMLIKGRLSVTTTDGHKYRMHLRKKQQGDCERLGEELDGALWRRFRSALTAQRLHVRAWPVPPLASGPPCGTCQGRRRPSGRTSPGRARQVPQTLIATADWADPSSRTDESATARLFARRAACVSCCRFPLWITLWITLT